MSAITYLTRKQELSYNPEELSRMVKETIIWDKKGSDFAITVSPYLNDQETALLDLGELSTLATEQNLPELSALLEEEKRRDGLEETDYEVTISY